MKMKKAIAAVLALLLFLPLATGSAETRVSREQYAQTRTRMTNEEDVLGLLYRDSDLGAR
jgi:hypothetical protein